MPDLQYTIHELLPSDRTINESMQALIDRHEAKMPQGNWSPFRKIDYDRDLSRLTDAWFSQVIEDDPPERVRIAALWFGLFQPVIDGNTVADFYLAGTHTFTLDSDPDWQVSPEYFPENCYAQSPVLATIYRLAYNTKNGLGNDAEQYLCLGYVAFAVKKILAAADLGKILYASKPIGVAVGWDSGGPLYIGHLTSQGFRDRNPAEAVAGIQRQRAKFEAWFKAKYPDST